MSEEKSVRLKNQYVPDQYSVNLYDVNLSDWTLKVQETIKLKAANVTDAVQLPCTVTLHKGASIDIFQLQGATVSATDEKASTITFAVTENPFQVSFANIVQPDLRGMYRCSYTYNGEERRAIGTHFEPTHARLCYICLDEPAARATFLLTVLLPKSIADYAVVSNAPCEKVEAIESGVRHQFEPIHHVPPYLTAIIIGDFEFLEGNVGKTRVRFYVTKGKLYRAEFGLKLACWALEHFEGFFQSPFPLSKLDLVALPDFPIGGMENWGCITLVENVLVKEETSGLGSLKGAAELICHEVSHNWFGNLVGIDWWEGLWLKEGFASWCGYYATDIYRPHWLTKMDVLEELCEALDVDGHVDTHPVEVNIRDPADIIQIFDAISYKKGQAIILMLQSYLGKSFSEGLAAYIKRYQYQNTKTDELWKTLEEVTKQPVASMMSSFTKNEGYPVVSFTVSEDQSMLQVTQRRYWCVDAPMPKALWTIPVRCESASQESLAFVLDAESSAVKLPSSSFASQFILANPGHSGYYRSHYPEPLFSKMLQHLAELSPSDRCGFQDDAFAIFKCGLYTAEQIIALIDTFANEQSVEVLSSYIGNVNDFAEIFYDDLILVSQIHQRAFQKMVVFAESYLSQKTDEDPQAPLLNPLCLKLAVQMKNQKMIAWCLSETREYFTAKKTLDANLAGLILRTAIREASDEFFELFYKKYHESLEFDGLCRMFLSAMCFTSNEEQFQRIAKKLLATDDVRSQYGGLVISSMSHNPKLGHLVWPLFRDRIDDFLKLWGSGQFRIQFITSCVANTLHTVEEATEWEKLFEQNSAPNAALSAKRGKEDILRRANLKGLHYEKIKKKLCE